MGPGGTARPENGPCTTIYNRWNRWSGRRVWGRFLDALIAAGRIDEVGQLDSRYVQAHRLAGGAKGPKAQAIGIGRGGRTSKIHAVCDLLGPPLALALTPGNTSVHQGRARAHRCGRTPAAPHRGPRP